MRGGKRERQRGSEIERDSYKDIERLCKGNQKGKEEQNANSEE